MKTIYKYGFPVQDEVILEMPSEAIVLHVGMQGAERMAVIWVLVDPDRPYRKYRFRIVGTGHPIPDADMIAHIGTFFDGPFVWHLFQDARPYKEPS